MASLQILRRSSVGRIGNKVKMVNCSEGIGGGGLVEAAVGVAIVLNGAEDTIDEDGYPGDSTGLGRG